MHAETIERIRFQRTIPEYIGICSVRSIKQSVFVNIYPVLFILTKSDEQKLNLKEMDFVCQHCGRKLSSKYNLKRHLERKHDSWSDSMNKNEKEEEESDLETSERNSEVETDSERSDSGDNSTDGDTEKGDDEGSESEGSDTFTYDDVRAILRYALQRNG